MKSQHGPVDEERVALSEAGSGSDSEDYYVPPREIRSRGSGRKYALVTFVGALSVILILFALIAAIHGGKGLKGASGTMPDMNSAVDAASSAAAKEAAIIAAAKAGAPLIPDASFEKEDGLFTVYRGTGKLSGIVLFNVPESLLDKPFVINPTWYKGNAQSFLLNTPVQTGAQPTAYAIKKSSGDLNHVDIYAPQFYITVEDEDSPLKASYDKGTFTGWYGSLLYLPTTLNGERGCLINMTPWILGGMSVVPLNGAMETETRIESISAFETSVRVEMDVEIQIPDVATGTMKKIAGGIAFTLTILPDKSMLGRRADERIGYFTTSHLRLDADRALHSRLNLINRRNFERTGGELIYLIDKTVPEKWRIYVKEGVEEWNKAFGMLKAGSQSAQKDGKGSQRAQNFIPKVKALLPGDEGYPEDFKVGDAMFNSISWAPSLLETFAVGPAVTDPRSGEILYSHIVFTHSWIRSLLTSERIFEGSESSADIGQSLQFMQRLSRSHLPVGQSSEQIVTEALKQIAMHEVGHTLGLRHNFHGSANYRLSALSDPEFVKDKGLTSSVMDYLPPLFRENPEQQINYYTQTLGEYDYIAIEYGYSPNLSEDDLAAVAQKAVDKGLNFATDEDLSSTLADPYVSAWDISSEPLDYNEESMRIFKSLVPKLKEAAIKENIPWYDFTGDVSSVVGMISRSLSLTARFVGGFVMTRARAGDQTHRANTFIDPALSTRALDTLARELHPVDGLLGSSFLKPHADVLIDIVGEDCDSIEVACSGQGPSDYVALLRKSRIEVLSGFVVPDRLNTMELAHSRSGGKAPNAQTVLSRMSSVFINDKIGKDSVAADAAAEWVSVLLQLLEGSAQLPAVNAAIAGELSAVHSELLTKHGNESDSKTKSVLWALAWKTKDHALLDSDGKPVKL
eukprot:Plantae.Rhodophyta-Purpureofilum_apyrenoidigerum.ctg1047.p1 GENE.Plantae.Rhodophyta-Purpureofilum_apyrenoidigerum.ctg1047~~Plantae.Rhodophyta-Purpureofilum_apyrenoidigerum.ctg1047.p1  ORF type:complete len:912 (+),score=156.00 Plantae.Rhodophyta-Purpureofilum_apyrenoidigerum.ctg1047:407-3142(+)